MNCPHCSDEVLIAIEHNEVEVDYCVGCKGIWLDAGELELLLGDAEAARKYLSIGSPVEIPKGEAHRKCPECNKRMTKEGTRSDPPVVFDHCPKDHGIWLDHQELETMLAHLEETETSTEVGRYLHDIFSSHNA
jgi:hypothetical protein